LIILLRYKSKDFYKINEIKKPELNSGFNTKEFYLGWLCEWHSLSFRKGLG